MTPLLLFVTNDPTIVLADGEPPYSNYSENTHLFVIAQEALRLGWRVAFQVKARTVCREISALSPKVAVVREYDFSDSAFQPDMMFFVNYPIDLAPYAAKNNCLIAYILNAHFWLELPEPHGVGMTEFWRDAMAGYVDFILTQNPRMADIGYCLLNILTGFPYRDRYLIAPNSFTPEILAAEHARYRRTEIRAQMQVGDDDIVIINSGGAWHWTDCDTFLKAFVTAVRSGARRLKFFQMGIRQPNNEFQSPIEQQFRLFMAQNFDLVETGHLNILEWDDAMPLLPGYNYGADIGLNVSRETAENYQSHRVRFMDYTKAGLPVLQTRGSYYGDHDARDGMILVDSGNVQSYIDVLMQLQENKIDLASRRAAMAKFRDQIRSDHAIPGVLKTMQDMGHLPPNVREAIQKDLQIHYASTETARLMNRPWMKN